MEFKDRLIEGTFLKRYKRFFADVEITNDQGHKQTVVAHCPNTGSMLSLVESPRPCKITFVDDPKRSLKYTLQMLKNDTSWVGVNTHLPNQIVAEAFTEKLIPHWREFTDIKREVKISAESRIDMVLKSAQKTHYVEVKNVTLAENGASRAIFPDCKTERGLKHLHELQSLIKNGHTAEMVFLVQRTDCDAFSPAEQIDPVYAKTLKDVMKAGVLVSAYPVEFLPNGIKLKPQKLAIEF